MPGGMPCHVVWSATMSSFCILRMPPSSEGTQRRVQRPESDESRSAAGVDMNLTRYFVSALAWEQSVPGYYCEAFVNHDSWSAASSERIV
jgi:hypothetical protein